MSRISQEKQYALVEACKKAGIDVTVGDAKAPSSEIVLADESGRKYKISKDLKVEPTSKQKTRLGASIFDAALIKPDTNVTVYVKPRTTVGKAHRRKIGFRKMKNNTGKYGKLKG